MGLRLGMDSKLETFRTHGALVRNYTNAKHPYDLRVRKHRD